MQHEDTRGLTSDDATRLESSGMTIIGNATSLFEGFGLNVDHR